MKKWKKLFAVTAVTALVFAMAACNSKDTSADPTEAPNPTEAPAEPTEAPVEPTEAPTEATAEPTEAPAEPTEAPVDPTEATVDPTEAPAEPTEAPADPTEAPADPTEAPAANGIVINFADLTAGGYGYEATIEDGGVNVTIAGQYQEIQYVLPEAVDLAQYSQLIVDVTSNNQLDIKLVNPDAELNEYSQLTPFKDNYTAEGAIESPIYIDLAEFAAYDLSQINFMAMVNDTAFRLNSMTFVKADGSVPTEPVETPDPTEAPAEPTETPDPTEAPVSDNSVITFADLTAGGYGYEATATDGVVKVTISAQYQELQYVLPEAIDLAQYKTLIVDVVSNSQLDIKLVNPEAELNEYNQATPFKDNYTAEGAAITEPVYIDLAEFAGYDLSQINFMAMANDCEFTLNNMTFVK